MVQDQDAIKPPIRSGDASRWTMDPLDADGFFASRPIGDLHVVNVLPGQVRGNHVHAHHREYICVLGDRVLVVLKGEDGARREMLIDGRGGPTIIRVLSGVAHAVRNQGTVVAYLIVYSDSVDQADMQPIWLIE
jgi:oxalate decarboxylase/phosphoglucose isomerase-like protein (cupin superfamily)